MYHHRRLRGPLRRGLARRLQGPEDHHPRPSGLRPRLPAAQQHGPQRDLRGDRQRPLELADAPAHRRGQVRRRAGDSRSTTPSLAGISLDGTRFFYTNTLRQLDDDADRPPLVARSGSRSSVASAARRTSSGRSPRRRATPTAGRPAPVWVHLYGGSTLDTELAPGGQAEADAGDRLSLGRPGDDHGSRTRPGSALSLRLRIPGWADGASLSRQRRPPRTDRSEPGTYAEVHRTWSAGDVVELTLPMRVRLHAGPPAGGGGAEPGRRPARADRLLPGVDRPARRRPRPRRRRSPRNVELTPRFDPALLGGVDGPRRPGGGRREPAWSGELYRELPDDRPEADRPPPDPLLRLGQPGPLGDDGLAAARLLRLLDDRPTEETAMTSTILAILAA